MVETDEGVAVDSGESNEGEPADPPSDTGLMLAGTLFGLGIGAAIAILLDDVLFGLSVGVALGVVIPSGIRGSRR